MMAIKIELRRVTPLILAKIKSELKIANLMPDLIIFSLFF